MAHQSVVNALRRYLRSIKLTLEQHAVEGSVIALGLKLQMSKPKFVGTLLVLSDILSINGNLPRILQAATLNLLDVEGIMQDKLSALDNVKRDPLQSGYLNNLETTLQYIDISEPLETKDLGGEVQSYIDVLTSNNKDRFRQVRIPGLFGYRDPRNVNKTYLLAIAELGELMSIDSIKLCMNSKFL